MKMPEADVELKRKSVWKNFAILSRIIEINYYILEKKANIRA